MKDRAPKVQSIEADTSFFDCAVVTLTLALTLDRADFVGPELYELMQNLELRQMGGVDLIHRGKGGDLDLVQEIHAAHSVT